MRERDFEIRESAALNIPASWRAGLDSFCRSVLQELAPECAILVGSVAEGTYTKASDLDVLVISDRLGDDFLARLHLLAGLRPRGIPVEALGYKPDEFRRMLAEGHVTALEAYHKGLPLVGAAWFLREREGFLAMQAKGLRRSDGSWTLPGR